jgi:hypothetical protein
MQTFGCQRKISTEIRRMPEERMLQTSFSQKSFHSLESMFSSQVSAGEEHQHDCSQRSSYLTSFGFLEEKKAGIDRSNTIQKNVA